MPSKRRGQALLLAVLLMVFAALLGSTFITVVALNLNQTARQEDQSSARQAATAGLQLIEQNLTNSPQGEKWRPEMLTPPPAPGDPDYNFYYTTIDRAQGWARNIAHPPNTNDLDNDGQAYKVGAVINDHDEEWLYIEQQRNLNPSFVAYVKFPDPRTATLTATTPTFLAEVRRVSAINSSDPSKYGTLQVSVIGLSENNEAVVERRVAVKGGYAQNPLTAAARSVTNWDFVNNVVPVGRFQSTTGNTIALTNVSGRFPVSGNFYVMAGAPTGAKQGAWVRSVTQTGNTANLTLAAPLTATVGDRVEMAAGLGAPARVDFNNDSTAQATTEEVALRTSQGTTPGSVWVNGSMFLFGNLFASNLRTPVPGTTVPVGGIRVSGLIDFREDSTIPTPLQPAAPQIRNATYNNNGTPSTPFNASLLRSSNPAFPFANVIPTPEKFALVNDGLNRIQNVPGAIGRDVKPFTPPNIDNQSGGLNRYRQLTKFSPPRSVTDPAASLYGYGQGIYINNNQDVEKINDTSVTPNRIRAMTSAELHEMWFTPGPTSGKATLRLSVPKGVGATAPSASLEEKHLRGWIGPDEFRARGALIELDRAGMTRTNSMGNPDPHINITRDSLIDSDTTAALPSTTKSWQSPTGSPLNGVYRQELPWPANGVIFAEGNIRIKGGAFDTAGNPDGSVNPQRSLTIVSMNNIYIEGSLNAGSHKILLLAKKNVILNPTSVLSRPDAQTFAVSSSGNNIVVNDATLFRRNDWIEIEGSTGQPRRVDNVVNSTTLQLNTSLPVTVGAVIRAVQDPLFGSGSTATPYHEFATRIGRQSDMMQRRMFLPGNPPQIRLAFRHSAQRKTGLTVQADPATVPLTTKAEVYNKLIAGSDYGVSVIKTNEKLLKLDYAPPLNSTADYPNVTALPPANNTEAAGISALDLQNKMLASTLPKFTSTTSTQNNYGSGTKQPRFFFLTAVGNRYDFGQPTLAPTLPLAPPLPLKRNVLSTNSYDIPMATTVEIGMNGFPSLLTNDRFNGTIFETVPCFGFNPNFGNFSAIPQLVAANEDVLTSDQSFYTGTSADLASPLSTDDTNYTLDARRVSLTPSADGSNALSIRPNDGIVDGTNTVFDFVDGTNAPLPFYRLSRVKLDGPTDPFVVDSFDPSKRIFQNVQAGYTINIEAFVYAQEGSWVVLPGDYFDNKLKMVSGIQGTYSDINPAPGPQLGEFLDIDASGGFSNGDYADLNRDGQITREEQSAVFRFRRYNYKINFTGAIAERQTMPVLTEGPGLPTEVRGAVQDWTDKWATTTLNGTSWNGTTSTSTINFGNIDSDLAAPANSNYDSINYTFDAAALNAAFNINNNDAGFVVPVMPGYEYSG